ncbi:MAG: hypothetical protein JWO94_3543 [Verrucomicrobiaceae bacterium]|nr:hypothetical protein [Verrucomicrobiaceae bacterium]
MSLRHTIVIAALLAAPLWHALAITPEQTEFFEKRIRPVLAQDCYECHSTSGKKKGGLLLDSRPGWQQGGDTGPALIPGDAKKSLLLQAIRHEDKDMEMPKAGAKLDAKVIADFEHWVNDGAPDPRDQPPSKEELAKDTDWKAILARRKQWWAFQPVKKQEPPVAGIHPVDAFVGAKLKEAGLKAAPQAAPAIILRRLSYVLTGMAPTPEEISDFQKAIKARPQSAVSEIVDTMLASTRYGETWARHWMDWVRYAETYGSEGDAPIPYAWRYRDYLIRAFNNDVPYPQMLREAVAGDMLPHPRINKELGINESALGIGQLRMVMHGFSPTDTLDEMVTFTDNQIDTVSKAFQGLTVSCARCHNHKFDAISQTDFYSWFGIFSSTHPAVIDVNLPERGKDDRDQLILLKGQIQTAVGKAWLKAAESLPVIPIKGEASKPAEPLKRWDLKQEKWFADGQGVKQGATKPGEFSIAIEGDKIVNHVHSAGVFSDLISTKDRGVLMSPRFKCEGGTLWMRSAGGGAARARYIVQNYPRTGTIHKAKEFKAPEDEKLGWYKLDLDYWKGDDLFIQCTTVADMAAETKLDERSWFGITEVVITPGTEPPPSPAVGGNPREAVAAWLNHTATDAQAELLESLLSTNKLPNNPKQVPEAAPLLVKYRDIEANLAAPTRAPGVLEADAHDAALFVRGDHKQPGPPVPRYFLDGIDSTPYKTANSGRLQLAESLAASSNPLTSRVIVNRLWHYVFGTGLVATPDNFGRLGEPPSHPELLDYLAGLFTDEGGSIKAMIKLLVTSQTFQEDDHAPPGIADKDPENKLLSHFGVRRLDAEAIRDSILALTGALAPTMYGESVSGPETRRSVYVKVIRNNLDDFLTVFDAPVPSSARGRRDATNVPAQSLTLLNSPRIKDWAARWAGHATGENDQARIRLMFNQALGRDPSQNELRGCEVFLKESGHAGDEERTELQQYEAQARAVRGRLSATLDPVRTSLMAAHAKDAPAIQGRVPAPYAEWDFEKGPADLCGHLPLTLEGEAHIDHGSLVLEGGGSFARSKPLPETLKTKTLEAWVMLTHLEQRGGGVISVQDLHGAVFDAIVFGEKEAGHWMAGSNNSKRTQAFNGPAEEEAVSRAVHLALVYAADGTITGYRDGIPYGGSYKSEGPAVFEANASEVLIGCRHGSGGGNKCLNGRVLRARLYDRALSVEEIAASRCIETASLSEHDVLAALTDSQRQDISSLQTELTLLGEKTSRLQEQLKKLDRPDQAWASLALSLINLKEFIYLK